MILQTRQKAKWNCNNLVLEIEEGRVWYSDAKNPPIKCCLKYGENCRVRDKQLEWGVCHWFGMPLWLSHTSHPGTRKGFRQKEEDGLNITSEEIPKTLVECGSQGYGCKFKSESDGAVAAVDQISHKTNQPGRRTARMLSSGYCLRALVIGKNRHKSRKG